MQMCSLGLKPRSPEDKDDALLSAFHFQTSTYHMKNLLRNPDHFWAQAPATYQFVYIKNIKLEGSEAMPSNFDSILHGDESR